jgi:hypothetical protein
MVTSAAVSIDYRKTFGTVNHILLRKLEVYDLNPDALQWFASFKSTWVWLWAMTLSGPLTLPAVLLKPTVCSVFFGEIVLKWLILAAVGFSISHSSDLTCLTPVRSGHLKPRHAILRSWRVFRDELLNLYFKVMSCLILSVLGNLIYCLYLTGLK